MITILGNLINNWTIRFFQLNNPHKQRRLQPKEWYSGAYSEIRHGVQGENPGYLGVGWLFGEASLFFEGSTKIMLTNFFCPPPICFASSQIAEMFKFWKGINTPPLFFRFFLLFVFLNFSLLFFFFSKVRGRGQLCPLCPPWILPWLYYS